jgi:hypothetical protein
MESPAQPDPTKLARTSAIALPIPRPFSIAALRRWRTKDPLADELDAPLLRSDAGRLELSLLDRDAWVAAGPMACEPKWVNASLFTAGLTGRLEICPARLN